MGEGTARLMGEGTARPGEGTAQARASSVRHRRARTRGSRALLVAGWTLIGAGAVVLLYLVYSLLFTGLETGRAQAGLLEEWEQRVGTFEPAAAPVEPDAEPAGRDEVDDPGVALGSAVAAIEFHRPGSAQPPVREGPLLVVAGVSDADLRSGPGHYPGTALPGEPGNFAVAGHRTTYGAPFFNLDELRPGDEVHATGRDGLRHVYEVVDTEVVRPGDGWVLDDDPLASGRPMLTLTTCHPRFSAAERLIVFAELAS